MNSMSSIISPRNSSKKVIEFNSYSWFLEIPGKNYIYGNFDAINDLKAK